MAHSIRPAVRRRLPGKARLGWLVTRQTQSPNKRTPSRATLERRLRDAEAAAQRARQELAKYARDHGASHLDDIS